MAVKWWLLCYLSKHVGSLIVLNFSRTSTVAFCVVVVVLLTLPLVLLPSVL